MPVDYLDYFKLRAAPFAPAPSSDFYFESPQHAQARDELLHVVESMQGFALLSGEVGCGKTTLLRHMQHQLPADTYHVVAWVVQQPCEQPVDFLRAVGQRLGVNVAGAKADPMLQEMQRHLQTIRQRRRRAVLLVDEAQMLVGAPVMEALRAMLNFEGDGYKLITVVLAGLPLLVDNVQVDAALWGRLACHAGLVPLREAETRAYVRYRLQHVGAMQPLFDDGVLARVHALTGGVPRLINTVCDTALWRMARAGQGEASMSLIDTVAARMHRASAPPVGPTWESQVDSIAAMVAGDSAPDEDLLSDLATPMGADETVELPGDSWPGVSAVGPFLGNDTSTDALVTPPSSREAREERVVVVAGKGGRRAD